MKEKKQNLKQITEFLFSKGTNSSDRKITHPSDSLDIKKAELNFLNFGIDVIRKEWRIRFSFTGSRSFYDYNINRDRATKWFDILMELSEQFDDDDMPLFEDEKIKQEEVF